MLTVVGQAILPTPRSLELTEGGSATYTVALGSQPTAAVTVTIASDNTDITLDTDAGTSGDQSTLTFTTANWNTPQTVTVSAGQDRDNQDDAATLAHTASGADYGSVTRNLPVTVRDDETTDYDTDDDGLIEVDSLAKLHAIRYDLDGDGAADTVYGSDGTTVDTAATAASRTGYAAGFANPASDQCDDGGTSQTETCRGYELTANLNFDTDGNGQANSGDAYWNGGAGWEPIGLFSNAPFSAIFEGNGHTISNLRIVRRTTDYAGLFGHVSVGDVRNVGLADAFVNGGDNLGSLVGWNEGGEVSGAWVTGQVFGLERVGGLVGRNDGTVAISYSTAGVSGATGSVGGLVGYNGEFASIEDTWASGLASGGDNGDNVGGLVGTNVGSVEASYATGMVSGDRRVGALIGALQDTIDGEVVTGGIFRSYADRETSGVTRDRRRLIQHGRRDLRDGNRDGQRGPRGHQSAALHL